MKIVLLISALFAQGQEKDKDKAKPVQAHPGVDQQQVDHAIQTGCKWVLGRPAAELIRQWEGHNRHGGKPKQSHLDMVVLTLAHSGFYNENESPMKELVEAMVGREIESTYTCALQALALQKINPRKYQWRLAQCAQFLVDNLCDNGQWDYGEKTDVSHIKTPKDEAPVVVTDDNVAPTKPVVKKYGTKESGRTDLLPSVPIKKRRKTPPPGDNSNTQYGCLGLRACLDAGIEVEKEVLTLAKDWWLKTQANDGGWGYGGKGDEGYGSMSVGAVGGLCILEFFLKEDFKTDKAIIKGVEWIGKNFDVTKNPKKDNWYLYYLYGLERAGILFGTDKFGTHDWYAEGATHLIQTQKGDGSWNADKSGALTDTCFAILFLRRGMAPLIRTGEAPPKKGK